MAWALRQRGEEVLALRFRNVAHALHQTRFHPACFEALEEATAQNLQDCDTTLRLDPKHRLFAGSLVA